MTTTAGDVSTRLLALSADRLGVDVSDLRPDALLADDLGLDSLAAIEWAMTIEDEFGIALPEDAWDYTRVYGQVDHLVRRLVDGRAAGTDA